MTRGRLYIVATPIGNLEDLTARAARVLGEVELIAAEDTRHSRKLLSHLGIATPLVSCHEHNERRVVARLLDKLSAGADVALISDAGTPLLSDPGYLLVTGARERSIEVVPVPGPSALTAALSVAGLPVNRFLFEGFLPATRAARRARLQGVAAETCTLIYYEAPHRVDKTLADMAEVFGAERVVVLARELTKRYEEVLRGPVGELVAQMEEGALVRKGEYVILVSGGEEVESGGTLELSEEALLAALLPEMPPRRAVDIVARLSGGNRKALYNLAVRMRRDEGS